MRDRLVELIKDGHSQYIRKISGKSMYEEIADYLLANGIIVQPNKVSDTDVMCAAETIFDAWNDVTGAVCKGTSWYYELKSVIEDVVKLSFGAGVLYREEAEQALSVTGTNVGDKLNDFKE